VSKKEKKGSQLEGEDSKKKLGPLYFTLVKENLQYLVSLHACQLVVCIS
jgi:hypothetical protein